MAQQSFQSSIDAWVQKTKARMEAVVKNAAESVIEEVVLRCPVDTGFLRASLTASLDGPLPMRNDKPAGAAPNSFDAQDVSLVIEGAQLGQTIYASFTARYASFVEYGTKHTNPVGMVRLSAANWGFHVESAVRQAKAAVNSAGR